MLISECKALNPTFLSKARCSPEEKAYKQIQKLFCETPMNFPSSFSSSALGSTTLDGDNIRHLGPLRLHGRNNLPLLSLWKIKLIQDFTWVNHILILHAAEQSHKTLPCQGSGRVRRDMCHTPHCTQKHLRLSLCPSRRAGVFRN